MKTEQHVLEWSKLQNCFHIQSLADSLAWAQKCFLEDRTNGWIVLMVADADAVHKMAATHRPRLAERTKVTA